MSLGALVLEDAGGGDEDAKQLEAHRLMAAIEKKDPGAFLTSLEKLIDLCTSSDGDDAGDEE